MRGSRFASALHVAAKHFVLPLSRVSGEAQCLQREVLINCLVLAATGDLIGCSHFLHFKDEEIDILKD